MTVKLSVSLPDDVAAWLQGQDNVSGAVADAVRARMDDAEARRQKRRRDAEIYVAWYSTHRIDGTDRIDGEDELMAASNEISLRGAAEW